MSVICFQSRFDLLHVMRKYNIDKARNERTCCFRIDLETEMTRLPKKNVMNKELDSM